jgi:hypothetical protein
MTSDSRRRDQNRAHRSGGVLRPCDATGVDGQDRVGEQSDRLIRLVALGLGEGLKEENKRVIRSFPQIKGKPHPVGNQMNAAAFSYQYA